MVLVSFCLHNSMGLQWLQQFCPYFSSPSDFLCLPIRIQKERFEDRPEDYELAKGKFIIDEELMKDMKKQSVVMHPLPRVDEVLLQ